MRYKQQDIALIFFVTCFVFLPTQTEKITIKFYKCEALTNVNAHLQKQNPKDQYISIKAIPGILYQWIQHWGIYLIFIQLYI